LCYRRALVVARQSSTKANLLSAVQRFVRYWLNQQKSQKALNAATYILNRGIAEQNIEWQAMGYEEQ
jgi:hypothetical protein